MPRKMKILAWAFLIAGLVAGTGISDSAVNNPGLEESAPRFDDCAVYAPNPALFLAPLGPTWMPAAAVTESDAPFRHPGILVNLEQLDFIQSQVAADAEPWKSAFDAARRSNLGSLTYEPSPWETVECGPFSNPDLGCKDEQRDSEAAYTQALLGYITGNTTYAENALRIMNAWSSTLRGGHIGSNGPVQAAWTAECWPRAGEIIRYTYDRWGPTDRAEFQTMLTTQYLPSLVDGSCNNGNWELSMIEAIIHIGVFNDDPATFEQGLAMWRGRTPAYIYMSRDGDSPVTPPNCAMPPWGSRGITTEFGDGLLQETCRDSQHANLGLSAMVNAAETAWQQGVDLYEAEGDRIMAALEFQAQFLPPNHAPVPDWVCEGTAEFHRHPTWEIAYNHYHNRLGYRLPNMQAVLRQQGFRPTGVDHQMVWETLTHAEVGAVGSPPVTNP